MKKGVARRGRRGRRAAAAQAKAAGNPRGGAADAAYVYPQADGERRDVRAVLPVPAERTRPLSTAGVTIEDTISRVSFFPAAYDQLAAASWDGSLFAWPTVSAPAEPLHANLGSGLVDMRFDPTVRDAVFVGCLDGAVRHVMVERLGSAEVDAFAPVVGMHDAGVRVLAPAAPGVMASADFNKGVKFWDVRAPKPVVDFRLGDKVHGMDCDGGRLVIATGGEKCSVLVYDLRKLCEAEYGFGGAPEPQRRKKSPMMFQTRVVRCFAEGKGFFLGGVDGRCGVQYHPGADDGKNRRGEAACFVFKCHRRNDVIFCVNDVACHPGNPDVMTTVGGDGSHFHWNKKKRTKLAGLKSQLPQSLTSCSLNTDASYLAYSCSYDWAQGYKQPEKCWQNMVIVETVADGTWTK